MKLSNGLRKKDEDRWLKIAWDYKRAERKFKR
jgi:hypothetical protein